MSLALLPWSPACMAHMCVDMHIHIRVSMYVLVQEFHTHYQQWDPEDLRKKGARLLPTLGALPSVDQTWGSPKCFSRPGPLRVWQSLVFM